jgi:hypothetical protein
VIVVRIDTSGSSPSSLVILFLVLLISLLSERSQNLCRNIRPKLPCTPCQLSVSTMATEPRASESAPMLDESGAAVSAASSVEGPPAAVAKEVLGLAKGVSLSYQGGSLIVKGMCPRAVQINLLLHRKAYNES